jgi:hypothetical protein
MIVLKEPFFRMVEQRASFEKFVDSLYYSESGLYGDAVTVSFSKYLSWQAMHFSQRKRKRSNKVSPRTFQTALVVAPLS